MVLVGWQHGPRSQKTTSIESVAVIEKQRWIGDMNLVSETLDDRDRMVRRQGGETVLHDSRRIGIA